MHCADRPDLYVSHARLQVLAQVEGGSAHELAFGMMLSLPTFGGMHCADQPTSYSRCSCMLCLQVLAQVEEGSAHELAFSMMLSLALIPAAQQAVADQGEIQQLIQVRGSIPHCDTFSWHAPRLCWLTRADWCATTQFATGAF